MPFCVAFFESTVDALLALVSAAMTLVASLVHPIPGQPQVRVLVAGDRADLLRRRAGRCGSRGPSARCRPAHARRSPHAICSAWDPRARGAIAALVERLPDASPVDPKVCGEDRHYWSKDIDQQTSPGEEAAAALVAIGTESLPSLITASRAPQWVARRNAVWALGALDDARGVAPALAALADREPPVRRVAAWALGALDADVAVTALIDALGDTDAGVRSQVAWALGAIGDRRAVDGLIKALKDQDETVRSQAAWALGAIRRSAARATRSRRRSRTRARRSVVRPRGRWGLWDGGESRLGQRPHRTDSHRPECRHRARQKRDRHQADATRDIRREIGRRHLEQQRRHHPRRRKRGDEAYRDTGQRQHRAAAHDHHEHRARSGAERQPQPNL